jgi:hypothetical protein
MAIEITELRRELTDVIVATDDGDLEEVPLAWGGPPIRAPVTRGRGT